MLLGQRPWPVMWEVHQDLGEAQDWVDSEWQSSAGLGYGYGDKGERVGRSQLKTRARGVQGLLRACWSPTESEESCK